MKKEKPVNNKNCKKNKVITYKEVDDFEKEVIDNEILKKGTPEEITRIGNKEKLKIKTAEEYFKKYKEEIASEVAKMVALFKDQPEVAEVVVWLFGWATLQKETRRRVKLVAVFFQNRKVRKTLDTFKNQPEMAGEVAYTLGRMVTDLSLSKAMKKALMFARCLQNIKT